MVEARIEIEGDQLKRERESHKWTQEELAEKINGSERTVRRWEKEGAMLRPDVLALLIEVFGKPLEEWGNANSRWNNVLFPQNPYFTGRERILQTLHSLLKTERTAALSQAISGLGGIGKTATAIEYAHRYAEEYEAVLWVRADTETLDSDFASLAAVLELPERYERNQSQAVEAVKRWLQHHNSWLLIFDNANDLKRIFDYLPGRARGAVLLTTRMQATGSYVDHVEIGKMTRNEGITFLLHRKYGSKKPLSSIDPQEREEAGKLWKNLEGLPLALDQAAAYLEETSGTFSDYLTLFETNRRDLMKRRGGTASEHPASVAATWLVTLKKIERERPAAAQLLRFCAFLHPDAIPEFMFIKGADALWSALQRTATDTFAWNEAIAELRKYSLVKREDQKKTLTMHRLLQAVIKDDMPPKVVRDWADRIVRVVCAAFPDPEPGSWSQCESLLPHALLAAGYIEEYQFIWEETGHLLYRMASYLQSRARYTEAEPLYQRALRIQEHCLGSEHSNVAATLDNLANLYTDQGEYAKAEPLYQRALHIREQGQGPGHLNVAISLEGLAILYREQGKYAEAEPLHRRALAIREQQLGPGHLQVASSLNNLAVLYKEQGRYAEAGRLYQRALAIREQQLGPGHPHVARALNNLAILCLMQGNYAEAELLHRRALAINEQAYGEEHPDTASSLNNLAAVYYEQGKYMEVAPLFQRALHILEQLLGKTHPHVARALGNLAETYTALGRYAEAEPLYHCAHVAEKTLPQGRGITGGM